MAGRNDVVLPFVLFERRESGRIEVLPRGAVSERAERFRGRGRTHCVYESVIVRGQQVAQGVEALLAGRIGVSE